MNRFFIRNGECGVETVFKMVSAKHRPWIMHYCYNNAGASYSYLKEHMPGVSDAALSRALSDLVSNDILKRDDDNGKITYHVSDHVVELIPALEMMRDLAEDAGYGDTEFSSYLEYCRKLIGNKWDSRIIWMIYKNDSIRFNELRSSIEGLTHKVLTEHLDNLIKNELVIRTEYDGKVPHVEYSLTSRGDKAYEIVEAIANWAIKHELIKPTIYITY